MCTTCGCGEGDLRIDGVARDDGHPHRHADGTYHVHADGGAAHTHAGERAPAAALLDAVHAAGTPRSRIVQIEQDILAKNDANAAQNRRYFAEHGIFALNLVSSPGSGKTTLLVRTIEAWQRRTPLAVIEGDQQTSRDADRVRATGVQAVQINTGKGCHLDAHMVGRALEDLDAPDGGALFIENVGNLVCPAAFDLGEAHKVVILSVTEGDDKPLKYPDMFHAADLMIVSKIDLLPYVEFDVARAVEHARRVNPAITVFQISSRTGEGMDAWYGWLQERQA